MCIRLRNLIGDNGVEMCKECLVLLPVLPSQLHSFPPQKKEIIRI